MTIGLILATAALFHLLGLVCSMRAPRAWLYSNSVANGLLLATSIGVLCTATEWEWKSTFTVASEQVHLRLDGLSSIFLSLLSLIGGLGAIYAWEYWSIQKHPLSAKWGRFFWSLLSLCMALVLTSSNGLHFLISWELFALSAYFLITLQPQKKEVRNAGWLYLAVSHAGSLLLFAFFALLAQKTGCWDLGPMLERTDLSTLFWLALLGFGVKAGIFPLHIWLPSAHANAPSHVSALMSGVAIKMGIYGIVRFSGWLPMPGSAGWIMVVLGIVSAVLGVVFALGQHDLKRLLAYHSVENIGIILLGIGFAMVAIDHGKAAWGAFAMAGALLHIWNHGMFKSLLFLGAGSVLHSTGTRRMSDLGGLWNKMPWTTALFALGSAAIAGLPPLNGFVSEWLIYLGMFSSVIQPSSALLIAIPSIILLALTGALALACFVKVCGVVFLGAPRTPAASHAHECGLWMRIPMLVLAGGCVLIGLAPFLFWKLLISAVASWHGTWELTPMPAALKLLSLSHILLTLAATAGFLLLSRRARQKGIQRRLTWDCGYTGPTPRMQYTAGSFAGTITEWFSWILRIKRHEKLPCGIFPQQAHLDKHTPETVLEKIIEPCAQWILWVSRIIRQFQNGRTHVYILYIILGLIALACMTICWS
ncbi:MAG: NADH-quinone oxidoreductase subunit H [Verrucomicrobia bacterium]|nr:NADH-quinone oxidoreductase subunit H [Verrucomicrobiota bacterium]